MYAWVGFEFVRSQNRNEGLCSFNMRPNEPYKDDIVLQMSYQESDIMDWPKLILFPHREK